MDDLDNIKPYALVGGACEEVGTEAFFLPENLLEGRAVRKFYDRPRTMFCVRCPILRECMAYGIKNERDGMWGGLDPRERSAFRPTHAKESIRMEDLVRRLRSAGMPMDVFLEVTEWWLRRHPHVAKRTGGMRRVRYLVDGHEAA